MLPVRQPRYCYAFIEIGKTNLLSWLSTKNFFMILIRAGLTDLARLFVCIGYMLSNKQKLKFLTGQGLLERGINDI